MKEKVEYGLLHSISLQTGNEFLNYIVFRDKEQVYHHIPIAAMVTDKFPKR